MKANADKGFLLVSSDESCTGKMEKPLDMKLILNFLSKILSPLFVKWQARNYTLLQEYRITWTYINAGT